MADKPELLAKLDEIEAEMKKIGFWHEVSAGFQSQIAQGSIESYLDAPTFELWLQAVFLPNARAAVEAEDLPDESQVGVMAMRQYDYMSVDLDAKHLTELLFQFDQLVCPDSD